MKYLIKMYKLYYKNILLISSLITIFSTSLNAKSERSNEYSECINHTNGIAMNSQYASCAKDEFIRQEKILNKFYNKLIENSTKEQQELLKKGQNSWLKYREDWCKIEEHSSFAPGGFANYYYCLLEKTEKQIAVIKEFSFETFN